jgi:hypothetical protein
MPTLASLNEACDALARVAERFEAGEMIRWAIQPRTGRRLIGTIGLCTWSPSTTVARSAMGCRTAFGVRG